VNVKRGRHSSRAFDREVDDGSELLGGGEIRRREGIM